MASIRERTTKTGETTWAVLYRHGKRQTSRTFVDGESAGKFKNLVELLGVDRALQELEEDDADGLLVDDLFEHWITWKATTGVTPRTLKDYRRDYDNWIRRPLGNRPAASIDELDVQKWVDKMAGQIDPKSVGDRHMILGGMYRFGVARSRRLVEHNPCLETELPKKRKKAAKGFTLPQWEAIHSYAAEHEPDAADLLLFLVATGWRFSEASALTPAAVEDYGDDVYVAVGGVHRRDADDRIVYVDGMAKSRAGVRRINLPPAATAMVRRRLVGKGVGDLLFTTPTGNMWISNNFNSRVFPRILTGAGIEKTPGMGPHFLRHTHVAILNRANVSVAKMQRRIGHENISTTLNVYGGMIDNTLSSDELAALDQMIDHSPAASGAVVEGAVVGQVKEIAQSSDWLPGQSRT